MRPDHALGLKMGLGKTLTYVHEFPMVLRVNLNDEQYVNACESKKSKIEKVFRHYY